MDPTRVSLLGIRVWSGTCSLAPVMISAALPRSLLQVLQVTM